MIQPAKTQKSMCELFSGFPKAEGALREVMDARLDGQLSNSECAEWLLELSTGTPAQQLHQAVKRNTITRKTKSKESKVFGGLFQWMIEFRNIRKDTAWQYLQRVQELYRSGATKGLSSAEALEQVQAEPEQWKNPKQLKTALKLLMEFEGIQPQAGVLSLFAAAGITSLLTHQYLPLAVDVVQSTAAGLLTT